MVVKQSLGTLVTGVTEDLSAVIRGEIELAKTEIRESAQAASKGAGLLVVAAGVAFFAVLFLLVTAAWVLVQLGLPYWAGFFIVALVLIATAVALAVLGRKQLENAKGLERSPASLAKTRELLSRTTTESA